MRKTTVVMLIALLGLFVSAQLGYCDVNVPVSASITATAPEMTVVIKELTTAAQLLDPSSGVTRTAMNFGTLTHLLATGADAGLWYSTTTFAALIYTNSFGRNYEVKSSCAGLSNGTTSLPAGSFGLVPDYQAADRWVGTDPLTAQGAKPTLAVLGIPGSAVATGKSIYRSEAPGTSRIIRGFYSLPPYLAGGAAPFTGYSPIPLSQAAGTYTGTVAITIAAY